MKIRKMKYGWLKCLIVPMLAFTLSSMKLSGQEYAIGADLSFLKSAEDRDFAFKENDTARPGLQIFKDHGYNWIRLRLFHTPKELPDNLGAGVFWWEPATMGGRSTRDFFDEKGNVLPVITVFDKYTRH
jgi:arabinogalactan endo-1,4-beta-galactosidase